MFFYIKSFFTYTSKKFMITNNSERLEFTLFINKTVNFIKQYYYNCLIYAIASN